MSQDYSRPLDVNRWTDYPELNDCLTGLVRELEEGAGRQRNRKAKETKRFRDALRCLVLDLYVAWKTDPALEIGISLSKGHYANKSRYRALFLGYTSFREAYDGLLNHGYLEITKPGFNDPVMEKGFVTRIRATDKLIRLLTDKPKLTLPAIGSRVEEVETIILRDSRKKPIEYEDTDEIRAMRDALRRINATLQAHWIDLHIRDTEFAALQASMRRDYEDEDRDRPFIDLSQRSLVRIFNNGKWDQGGRFYRGWWQSIPKKYRRFITIDNKRTVEIDYSSLHPSLLYAEIEQPLEGDAYDIPALAGYPRALIKTTFNAMLNASGTIAKPQDFDCYQGRRTWQTFQQAIRDRHAPIASFFNSGYGLRLQRLDSDLAQAVMLQFSSMGYVCLPVHDSFLVHYGLDDELDTIMRSEFQARYGYEITTKLQQGEHPPREIQPDQSPNMPLEMDIATLFRSDGPYSQYDERFRSWFRMKG